MDFHPNKAETHFVFGGDLFDHGPGDLRMAECLLNFKQKYPEQVTLLAGNRDLNKLRLLAELDPVYLQLPPDDPGIFVPYWVPKKYLTTLAEHIEAIKRVQSQSNSTAHSPLDFVPQSWRQVSGNINVDTPEERLRWMLKHTMGARGSFEFRRHELAVLRGDGHEPVASVSDNDVLNSYRDSVRPGGILRDYLLETDIMKIIGDTLFVHGGVTEESMGFVPAPVNHDKLQSDPPGTNLAKAGHSVQDWIVALNEYCAQGIADWVANPLWNSDRTQRGGSMVMGCVATARTRCISACGTHMGAMWQVWVSSRHEWSYCDGAKLYGASTAP